jgi:hypothetical protein
MFSHSVQHCIENGNKAALTIARGTPAVNSNYLSLSLIMRRRVYYTPRKFLIMGGASRIT